MPVYAAASVNGALPSIGPVTTKSDMVVNEPVQSTIVSSKQFEDHTKLKAQLHNSVLQKQKKPNGSMVSVKPPHASQVDTFSQVILAFSFV
jgi:YTH domain-containing family protein